jgi:inosine/xanthosine triphosphatase
MHCFAWIVIGDAGTPPTEGKARTCTFDTPPLMATLVKGGMELGHANDKVFSLHNSKQHGGAVGSLTGPPVRLVSLLWDAW